MKTKILLVACALTLLLASTPGVLAQDGDWQPAPVEPTNVVADIVVVRPVCFVATVLGSVFFVISLPIAAASKSVHQTAKALVVKPARATFTRPLGDMESLTDY